MNNRIHDICLLIQNLNQRVTESNRIMPELLMNEMKNYDKPSMLIDWEYIVLDNGIIVWKNVGIIRLKGIILSYY